MRFFSKFFATNSDAIPICKLLPLLSQLTQEEKLQELDYEIEEKDKRVKNLAINVNKVIAREQRKLSAPEELDNLKGGRQRKIFGAAVKIQACMRGTLARRHVAQQMSNVRVAGALQMLVQELGGSTATEGGERKQVAENEPCCVSKRRHTKQS